MTNHYPNEQDAAARVREREGAKATTERATASPENLVRFLKTVPSQRKAGDLLGCSGSSISGWLRDGAVPLSIDLACRFLLSQGSTVIRVRATDLDQAVKIMGMLDLLGVPYTEEPR